MTRRWAVAGLIVLTAVTVTTASAKKKKDTEVSRVFCQAQYAYVETIDGDVMNPNVLPVDRDAANQLMNNLQSWKRYILVYRPSEANLVFVVRTGRLASPPRAQGRVATGPPYSGGRVIVGRDPGGMSQNPPGVQNPGPGGEYPQGGGMGAGAETDAGPRDDLLRGYSGGEITNRSHPTLWERTQADGLQGSQPLFEHLRDAVEKSCVDSGTGKGSH